jgi:hypothetical protein
VLVGKNERPARLLLTELCFRRAALGALVGRVGTLVNIPANSANILFHNLFYLRNFFWFFLVGLDLGIFFSFGILDLFFYIAAGITL